MKTYYLLLALTFLAGHSLAAGVELRRAEETFAPDCKTLTNSTAIEFFSVSLTTAAVARRDEKFVIISSLDDVATNYIVISTWAATTNVQGIPLAGMGPHKLEVGPNVKLFARKGTATGATTGCMAAFK